MLQDQPDMENPQKQRQRLYTKTMQPIIGQGKRVVVYDHSSSFIIFQSHQSLTC